MQTARKTEPYLQSVGIIINVYKDVNSNHFTAQGYQNIYHNLYDPEPENAYKLKGGISF